MDHCHIPASVVLNYLLLIETVSNYENVCALHGKRKISRISLFSKGCLILLAND